MKEDKNNLPAYLFHQGTNYRAYEYMGAHRSANGYVFRVWAPNADNVYLVGDFNGWGESDPMERITDGGIWEISVGDGKLSDGSLYKFKIRNGEKEIYKADPYAFECEHPPRTASVITSSTYKWRDAGWLAYRRKNAAHYYSSPLSIYEVHLGSWKRHADGTYYSYRESAAELAPYVKQMGYTHIELMPVMEHPFDGSWGYQICGYYAPTSRFGTPDDFRAFVDTMHEAGIGVILDWVPAHFPKDDYGLCEFDGQPLYEYQGEDRMEHAGWGTRRFDVGRNEVESFLVSNALYWLGEFHADGLRVDAVASMLYLDYDKKPGEWVPNIYGGNKCLEAVSFFGKLNSAVKSAYPDVLMIAEESTAFANVTTFDNGGLGFDLKWNMGWMNDTLAYAAKDPIFRKYEHEKTTFSMTYAFSEKYILPISHDEVVHGKKSFLDKMPGDYWQKFANTRAFAAFMMTHPGKKLMFMGCEIGQFREWDFEGSIEWFLLDYESHAKLQRYFAELNQLYLRTPALWQNDSDWNGFCWIDADNRDDSIISYRRTDRAGKEVIVVINFTPVTRRDFTLGVPYAGNYGEIFNSDDERYGGSGVLNPGTLKSTGEPWRALPDSLKINVPPLGAAMFACTRKKGKSKSVKKGNSGTEL
ncbi:MAG: 1,4-alpha-glucan branching protein GlgB [Eubacteriales bacterium]